jgi:hypothetical protein
MAGVEIIIWALTISAEFTLQLLVSSFGQDGSCQHWLTSFHPNQTRWQDATSEYHGSTGKRQKDAKVKETRLDGQVAPELVFSPLLTSDSHPNTQPSDPTLCTLATFPRTPKF